MRIRNIENGVEIYPSDHPLQHIAVVRPRKEYARPNAEISWGASGPMSIQETKNFIECLNKAITFAEDYDKGIPA